MKRALVFMLALAMVMSFVACGGQNQQATEQQATTAQGQDSVIQIALITKMVDSPYWQTVKNAAVERANELGNVQVTHLGPPTEADIDKQVQIVETCINDNYDGIILAACDRDALVEPVRKAKEAGIPVVMIDSGISEPVYDAFLATNNVQAGADCAKLMASLIGEEGEVGIINFAAGTSTAIDRETGFTNEMNNYPNITIVGIQYCDSDPTKAANQATDMIRANPNIKGLWGANDQSAVGVVQAVVEQGKTDSIMVVGFDDSDDIMAALNNGTLKGTAIQMPTAMGSRGVDLILDIRAGRPPADKDVDTGVTIVETSVKSQQASGQNGIVKIALVTKMVESPYWQTVKDAAVKRASEIGNVEVTHLGPPTEADIDKQVQIIETCINDDYDGIILAACDRDALVEPVRKAKEAGIPVVMIDSGISEPVYDAFLATNNVQAGAECAKLMSSLLGGSGEVGIINFAAGTSTAIDREKGFTEEMLNHPGISIVGIQYCDSDPTKAANQATDMIAANPDIKGLWGANDQSAIGVVQAVTERGRADSIVVVGFDNSDDIKAALNNGTLKGTAVQMPTAMGSRGVELILDLRAGRPPASKDVDTGVTMVDQNNLNDPDIQAILNQ